MLQSQTVNVKRLNLKKSKERNSNNLLIRHHLDKDHRRMKLGFKHLIINFEISFL